MSDNLEITKQIIIIGGGASVNTGIELSLKDILYNKFSIACNYAYRHFPHTFLCFVDYNFYHYDPGTYSNNANIDIYEDLKKESLIVGYDTNHVGKFLLPNTLLVKGSGTYLSENSQKGFYTPMLCGIFALNLAIWLSDFEGEIFLLGYDWTKEGVTHYYKDVTHRGNGFVGYYRKHHPDKKFMPFLREKKIKIYNVIGEPESNISCFEKIDYFKFYELISSNNYNQEVLRGQIRGKITCIS